MADGLGDIDWFHAGEGKHLPAVAILFPVERRTPITLPDAVPSSRQPEFGPLLATVIDEGEKFAPAARPRGNRKRLEPAPVPRSLIVEAEAHPAMADLDEAAFDLPPASADVSAFRSGIAR